MLNFLKNLPFTILLFLVGVIFIFLSLSNGIAIKDYSFAIQESWAKVLSFAIGLIATVAATYFEIKLKSSNKPEGLSNETTAQPEELNSKVPAHTGELGSKDQNLHLGAILYFKATKTNGYGGKFTETIRQYASELFQLENQTYPPTGLYYYWYKQGGDGFSFFIEPHKNEGVTLIMAHAFFIALSLLKRLQTGSVSDKLSVSVVLHTGDDLVFSQHGKVADYWGQSLDTARDLAESLNDRRFIISQEAFSHLSRVFPDNRQGNCKSLAERMKNLAPITPDSDAYWLEQDATFNLCEWKLTNQSFHNQTIYNFTISDKTHVIVGNPSHPSDLIQLEYRDTLSPSHRTNRFINYLIEADEVCIVGMTHENTAKYLATALEARKKFWGNIQIIFPSEQTLKEVKEQKRSFEQRKEEWEDSKKELIIFFERQGPEYLNNWSCIECDENFSFWGNRFVIGDKGVIRIAPLIQGADLKYIPYMTFSEEMDTYKILSEAFDVLLASGNSIVEWDLFGELKNDEFIYQGITSHAKLSAFPNHWKPVTLVMLHTREIGQQKMLLQKRSIFNATDAYDKYSNISGRLCVSDVAQPDHVRRFYREVSELERRNRNTTISSQQESSLATDLFSKIAEFNPEQVVAPDAWANAAFREIQEELGIPIDKSRLYFQKLYNLTGNNLNFRIYSLEISAREYREINERRPHSGLEPFGRSRLTTFYAENRFNRLLQNRFEELFVPIFDNLKIAM